MKLSSKPIVATAALAVAIAASVTAAIVSGAKAGRTAETYTVCIDIPFHPIFDYVMAKNDTYFAGKPYTVNFKILDATTQLPAFGAGQCDVITTPPSFIPRVTERYHIQVAEFFPLARWVIGPQILVKVNSSHKTLADLKGKKVAIPPLATLSGAQIHPSCCSGVFVDQSAESVALLELVWRVRSGETETRPWYRWC